MPIAYSHDYSSYLRTLITRRLGIPRGHKRDFWQENRIGWVYIVVIKHCTDGISRLNIVVHSIISCGRSFENIPVHENSDRGFKMEVDNKKVKFFL